jgi:hypothetical protein
MIRVTVDFRTSISTLIFENEYPNECNLRITAIDSLECCRREVLDLEGIL